MNQLKKLARDTITYGLSSMLGRLLNYLLVPFYTSLLLPAEYGIITELYAYMAFLNIFYSYGMETTYLKFATTEGSQATFRLTNSMLLCTSIVFSSLLIALAWLIVHSLGYPGKEIYIYLMAVILWGDTLLILPFARLRLLNRPMQFATLKCWQIGMNVLLNILFLYVLPRVSSITTRGLCCIGHGASCDRDHITYILLANVLGNISVLPWVGISCKDFTYRVAGKQVKKILVYALPLLIMGLAGMINEMLSRVLLKHILPMQLYPGQSKETILGVFGACYKLTMLMALAMQAFRYAVEPFFFKHAVEKDALPLFSKVMQAYMLIGCWVWLAISVNVDLLAFIFLRNPAYRVGIHIVPYLALSYLWLGIYYNLSIWFKVVNKNYYGTIITAIGAVITILLNVSLVPYWGYMGSVYATLCSYISMAILCYYQGQKHYPVPYKIREGVMMMGITGMLIMIIGQIHFSHMSHSIVSNMTLTGIAGGAVYAYLRKIA